MTLARLPGTLVFGALTLLAVAGAILLYRRALGLDDPLGGGFALVVTGAAAMLAYETFAYGTRLAPTISLLVAGQFAAHPVVWVAVALVGTGLLGALTQHFLFAGHRRHLAVLAGCVLAYVVGAAVTEVTGWVP